MSLENHFWISLETCLLHPAEGKDDFAREFSAF